MPEEHAWCVQVVCSVPDLIVKGLTVTLGQNRALSAELWADRFSCRLEGQVLA